MRKHTLIALMLLICLLVLIQVFPSHTAFAPNVQQIWQDSQQEPSMLELMQNSENTDIRDALQDLSVDLQTVTVARDGPYVWIDTPRDPPRSYPSANNAWKNKYFPQPELEKYLGPYVPSPTPNEPVIRRQKKRKITWGDFS